MNSGLAKLMDRLRERDSCQSVCERIVRLNPNGVTAGTMIRGWRPKKSSRDLFAEDSISPRRFIAEHGIEAYRGMDKRWWRRRGLQKYMYRSEYLDNVWKYPFSENFYEGR